MVYWFLSTFVSASLPVLLEKLTNLGISAYGSFTKVDEKLKRLERTLKRTQYLISEAEDKKLLNDDRWKGLLQELDKVAYDADDLIDEIAIKILKVKAGKLKNQDQVRKLLSSFYKHTSALNMNAIQAQLDALLGELEVLSKESRPVTKVESKQQTTSLLDDESCVFGREVDKNKVIEMLYSSDESSMRKNDHVSVIAIIGMAGIGKTTLAQLVYNHDYIEIKKYVNFLPFSRKQSHFNLKMWFSVTDGFDVMKLTRSIIEANSSENTSSMLSLDALQVKLKGLVRGKRFLLVFDNLQGVERNQWELLLKPLNYGVKGSKIIVTTRSHEVSKLVSAAKSHFLQYLSEADCWSLLKEEALGNINPDTVPELIDVGIKLAMECKGLPLAAKKLGAFLRGIGFDRTRWNNVLNGKIWHLIVRDLGTGYHPLPTHIRQCFAYCSLFPQNYEFEKDKMVQMWMGEGFVIANAEEERKVIEEIGSDYFDHFWRNSLLQLVGEKYYMHDALRELAQSISGEKFFRLEKIDDLAADRWTRHLSLVCELIQTMSFKASCCCESLRSLLVLAKYKLPVREVPDDLFQKLERLRVLDLSGTHVEELTGNIGNLKHLRFLDLSNTLLKWVPEDVKELCILQTLRLRNCLKLLYLPKNTGKLTCLQHLEFNGSTKLARMPSGIGNLTSLQTMGEFIVGQDRGQLMELKNMNKLRGSLCIKQLDKVNSFEEAVGAKLADKEFLSILELQWASTSGTSNSEDVLKSLKPHGNLEELTLRKYGGTTFPTWISDPLFSKLTSICLYNCENCIELPPLGKLPRLKSVKVVGMLGLLMIGESFVGCDAGFQSLGTLEISDMPSLESWVGLHENDMAKLCELLIEDCPLLHTLPSLHHLQSLNKLRFESCPKLPCLPEEGLPSSVETLVIQDCPLLEDCCQEDGGEDWLKTRHIQCLQIGDMQ